MGAVTVSNSGGAHSGKIGWMTILVWACYPIVWLFSEGFASFSVSFEITMYAILDVINKVPSVIPC